MEGLGTDAHFLQLERHLFLRANRRDLDEPCIAHGVHEYSGANVVRYLELRERTRQRGVHRLRHRHMRACYGAAGAAAAGSTLYNWVIETRIELAPLG